MLEILDIAKNMPTQIQDMEEAHLDLALSPKDRRMYERFFGLAKFPRDADQSLKDMTDAACELVARRAKTGAPAPAFVVHCHTLLSCGPCHSQSTSPLDNFRRAGIEVFSATMNHCASSVAVLEMIEAILPPDQTALVIVGDKAFHPAVRLIENTTIMGDGAVAMLVGHTPGRFRYRGGHTSRMGEFSLITGRLGESSMNGFEQYYNSFTAKTIMRALAETGLSLGEIRMILPHNVNLPSWQQIAKEIGIQTDQIYLKNVGRYGHTFAADPFLNLLDIDAETDLKPGDLLLLVSVGLGATAACAILEYNEVRTLT